MIAAALRSDTGRYTACAVNGVYDLYVDGEDTGTDITVIDEDASATLDYYTVRFRLEEEGLASGSTIQGEAEGVPIASGAVVRAGTAITLRAAGAGAFAYDFTWDGIGTAGKTADTLSLASLDWPVNAVCTVTGRSAPLVLTVITEESVDPGTTTVTLSGSVVSNDAVTERGFVYGNEPSVGSESAISVTAGSGAGQSELQVTGLQPGTVYYARAYAVSRGETVYGETIRFVTGMPAPSDSPTVTVTSAQTIPASSPAMPSSEEVPATGDGGFSGLLWTGLAALCMFGVGIGLKKAYSR